MISIDRFPLETAGGRRKHPTAALFARRSIVQLTGAWDATNG
jgi:hypothetical protein